MALNYKLEKQLLIELAVKNILSTQFPDAHFSGTSYSFRCHICGDSKKNSFKKRGHIYTNNDPWVYHCYNGDCNAHMTVETWLKTYFPLEYNNIIVQLSKLKVSTNSIDVQSLKDKIDKIKIKRSEKPHNEKYDVSFFKSILKYPNLIDYCEGRLIPKSVYSKWYYADGGFYKERLIIPFYDNNNKIYYYQGRSLNDNTHCKYLSRIGVDLNSIYNFYNVDKSQPVIVLEGPIDSIFITNSIGLTGLKVKTEHLKDIPYKYFLFDCDESGFKKSQLLLKTGEYVFNWKSFLSEYKCKKPIKDINDFIMYNNHNIKELNFDILKKYFTNNINHRIFFVWGK